MIKWCVKCIAQYKTQSNFDKDGICNACKFHEKKK